MPPKGRLAPAELDQPSAVSEFRATIEALCEDYRPSRMPFFARVRDLPEAVASDPHFLGQVHLNWQAMMHALRVAAYHLPHLDSPALRRGKLRLLTADAQPPDETPHARLTRAFRNLGAAIVLDDEDFAEPEEICCYLDGATAHFVHLAQTLYGRSLGACCVAETLAAEATDALAAALAAHAPAFRDEPCFAEAGFRAAEATALTEAVLRARPELLRPTLRDARPMAEAIAGVIAHLDRIARDAAAFAVPRRGTAG